MATRPETSWRPGGAGGDRQMNLPSQPARPRPPTIGADNAMPRRRPEDPGRCDAATFNFKAPGPSRTLAATGRCWQRRRLPRGFSLVELLVYMTVLVVILGVGYSALYHCLDQTAALSRSTDDIANALHAGEDWRADLRNATGLIQVRNLPQEQILQ